MEQQAYNQLIAFIWNIANDCLVGIYNKGDYRKIILPMIVIRRFDAVLEPTKKAVLDMKASLDEQGITDQDDALKTIAKEQFVNSSPFTLKDLKSRTNQQQLKRDFILYLDGFSKNVQEIIDKFKFRNEIDTLSETDILGMVIGKFVDPRINLSSRPVLHDDGSIKLAALDNHSMGTAFEELLRKFNEENNVTEAGEHFTPRDIVELMSELAITPLADKITNTTYRIYDGACGTGGILTVAEARMKSIADECGKRVSIYLFGQELQPETYAIARSDMMIKGEGKQAERIAYGSTISNDAFARETFDFMISNPPFGTPWRKDLEAWGYKDKKEITDSRFVFSWNGDSEYSILPNIGDPQMLFLANNISKMKTGTPLGSRIVEVHNGSSLFTGSAGQGESNLRRYIIENDWLEAIVALPENMFYNTGIGTYLWIVTNKKSKERKGKIQLIDATSLKSTIRKNLGEKNGEITPQIAAQILEIHQVFDQADPEYSRVFENSEFGYWEVPILRPLKYNYLTAEDRLALLSAESKLNSTKGITFEMVQCALRAIDQTVTYKNTADFRKLVMEALQSVDAYKALKSKQRNGIVNAVMSALSVKDETADPVLDKDGSPVPDKSLSDKENVPYTYVGGVKSYFEIEIEPYVPDAWVDEAGIKIGYEISFSKYFFKPAELRSVENILADIEQIERDTDGLLASIVREVRR
jgi:type I restriction enzyme M protein